MRPKPQTRPQPEPEPNPNPNPNPGSNSVEQFAEEPLAPLVMPVMPVMPMMPVGRRRITGPITLTGPIALTHSITLTGSITLTRRIARTAGRRIPGRHRRRRRVSTGLRAPGSLPTVPARFGIEQFLELTTIEEDPSALRALIDRDAATFVHPHLAMTLRTGHLHLTDGTRQDHRAGLWRLCEC
jgi:hypothetical protein